MQRVRRRERARGAREEEMSCPSQREASTFVSYVESVSVTHLTLALPSRILRDATQVALRLVREQQRRGARREDGVVERLLGTERDRHRHTEQREQCGTRECRPAQPEPENERDAEHELGRRRRDRQEGNRRTRHEG